MLLPTFFAISEIFVTPSSNQYYFPNPSITSKVLPLRISFSPAPFAIVSSEVSSSANIFIHRSFDTIVNIYEYLDSKPDFPKTLGINRPH